jgi:uncharacterized protein YihD (DUF1040 family)
MKDPKRIKPMMEIIRGIWEQNPDLRLGQLIENACPEIKTIGSFYIEDEHLLKGLKAYAKKGKTNGI